MSGRAKRARKAADDDAEPGLMVRSDLAPDGTYLTTVAIGADTIIALTPEQATAYALTAVEAAQRAEYDAAIFALVTRRLKLPAQSAVELVGFGVRPDRPPLNDAATAPARFVPGVNQAGAAFMHVHLQGEPWGQISPQDLREHAMWVLEAPSAVDLDSGFYRALRGIDVDEQTARAAVEDIANYR